MAAPDQIARALRADPPRQPRPRRRCRRHHPRSAGHPGSRVRTRSAGRAFGDNPRWLPSRRTQGPVAAGKRCATARPTCCASPSTCGYHPPPTRPNATCARPRSSRTSQGGSPARNAPRTATASAATCPPPSSTAAAVRRVTRGHHRPTLATTRPRPGLSEPSRDPNATRHSQIWRASRGPIVRRNHRS